MSSKFVLPDFDSFISRKFNKSNSDITFVFQSDNGQEEEIVSHRRLLSENAVFRSELYYSPERIEITHVSYAAFKAFLNYFYKNQVDVTQENLEDMVKLARHYQVDDLMIQSENFLVDRIKMSCICQTLEMAMLCRLPTVIDACANFIGQHAAFVFATEGFMSCDKETLTFILQIEPMDLAEEFVLDACMAWARKQSELQGTSSHPAHCRKLLGNCFELIRFPEMEPIAFMDRLSAYDGFFTLEEKRTLYTTVNDELKFFRNSVKMGSFIIPKFMCYGQ